ncbi:MAG: hypothetical protein J6I80_00695 [Clostridia bacterium]|nr:hypothetical protein [Clostridia bacterium]
MNYSIYDKVLLKYMLTFSIIAFICLTIAIVGVIFAFRYLDKEAKIVMTILLSIVLIIVFYFCFGKFPKYIYDIKNDAYITYTGDFEVSDKYTKGSAVFVYIDNNTQLESYSGILPGNYTGTVIYAERSAIAFDVKIEKQLE